MSEAFCLCVFRSIRGTARGSRHSRIVLLTDADEILVDTVAGADISVGDEIEVVYCHPFGELPPLGDHDRHCLVVKISNLTTTRDYAIEPARFAWRLTGFRYCWQLWRRVIEQRTARTLLQRLSAARLYIAAGTAAATYDRGEFELRLLNEPGTQT